MTRQIDQIKPLLKSRKRIAIVCHARPDGDAIGSSLGLYHYLKHLGHEVRVVVPNSYAEFLQWLPGDDTVIDHYKQSAAGSLMVDSAEIVFCLDFNNPTRVEGLTKVLRKTKAIKIMIDHHRDPEPFAKFRYWDPEASSTAELIYEFICDMGDGAIFSEHKERFKDLALCLYVGMLTDTGSFKYTNTSPKTFRIAGDLLAFRLDIEEINDRIYNTFTTDRLTFFGYCLSEKMEIFPEYKTGLIHVTKEEIERFRVKTGYTEGLVNYPLSIKGIVFAVLIIDRISQIKLSFRSKGNFDVERFAKANFSGGGHEKASGGSSKETLEETVARFKALLPLEPGLANPAAEDQEPAESETPKTEG